MRVYNICLIGMMFIFYDLFYEQMSYFIRVI